MSAPLRFDGRVAIVTGGGRGLGRAQALMLAERGAKVVVNDLGCAMDGTGADPRPATEVVEEIRARGGEAVASTVSVVGAESAASIVETALERFGRVDVVINNAGIIRLEDFPEAPLDVFTGMLDVHLAGPFNVTRAAWPHLVASGRGRVLMTTSAAAFGVGVMPGYAAGKAGLIGLARSLAQAGEADGVKVNLVCPSVVTRMSSSAELRRGAGETPTDAPEPEGRGRPEEVSQLVLCLVHDSCPTSGEILTSNGTNVGNVFLGETRGYTQAGLSAEDIAAHWDAAFDRDGWFAPTSATDHVLRRAELRA